MQSRDQTFTDSPAIRTTNGACELPAAQPARAQNFDASYRAILETRLETRLEQVRSENARARAAVLVRDEAEQRLALAVGPEALARWHRYVAEERRQVNRFRFQLSGARDLVAKQRRLRARTRAEALQVREELGIDGAKVREVHEWAQARFDELADVDRAAATDGARMVLQDDPALELLDGHQDPAWLVFTPPFHSQDSYDEGWSADFEVDVASHVSSLVGQVGQRIHLGNGDASDFDAAAISEHGTNAVIFITPRTGPLEVWVEAQALGTHHHLRLEDELGWSAANVTQKNWLTMQTFTGGASARREILTSHFRIEDATDGSWDTHFVNHGDTSWFQFFSDRSFQEGELVWMDIGSLSYNYSSTNDVEVSSTVDFKWFLRQVLVRPTGV